MKKLTSTIALAVAFATMLPAFAQMKVSENGKVLVGTDPQQTPLSKLSVGTTGDA